jgi:acyl CoA:acetate/3-ketoacid CoA transferase alpha subunit
MSEEITGKDIGALEAQVAILINEVHLLRKEMAQVNAVINQGKGGLYVLLLTAGVLGSGITLLIKKFFGG